MKQFTTFENLQYERPDFEALKEFYKTLTKRLEDAKSYEEVRQCMLDEEEYSSHVDTMGTIASIRHTVDTSDKFYEQEDEFLNHEYPEAMPYIQKFNTLLLTSPFRKQIDEEFGEQLLKAVQLGVDSFSEKNIALMQEESELCNRYQKLVAECKIPLDGEERNLYGIMTYFSHLDREKRKEAAKLYAEFFQARDKEMGEIFDRLVKIRHQMGLNMGF